MTLLRLLPCCLLWSCLSQSPPLPPVRWFDPLPASGTAAAAPSLPPVRVEAVPFVRQSFAVQVGARELAIDEQLRWIAPPEQLVERVLAAHAGAGGTPLRVLVTRFLFDATAAPRAIVAVEVGGGELGARRVAAEVEAPARDDSPAALAAAMASALVQLPAAVAAAIAR